MHGIAAPLALAGRRILFRRLHGAQVRVHRLLPQSQPHKDMRRHVLGVRRGRRDPGIPPCRFQAFGGQHFVVIAVDQVVRYAGMAGQFFQQRLQDLAALALVGIALVAARRRFIQRQRIKDRCFNVVRICRMQFRHLPGKLLQPLVQQHIIALVKRRNGFDVLLLARTLLVSFGNTLRFGGRGSALGHIDLPPQAMQMRHGDSPLRHGAIAVFFGQGSEGVARLVIFEGVQQRHCMIELGLQRLVARGLEIHRP